MGLMAATLTVDVLVTALFISIASKLVFIDARPWVLFAIVTVVSLVSLIPYVGWVLGLGVFVLLLMYITKANLLQCSLVVLPTRLLSLGAVLLVQNLA